MMNINLEYVCYFGTLLGCIALGESYKSIDDPNTQQTYGAGLGLLVVIIVCGWKTIHAIILVTGNAIMIKCSDNQYIHQISLAFTLVYMMYLHSSVLKTWAAKYIFETIALRAMGIAFSIYRNEKSKEDKNVANEFDSRMGGDPQVGDIICFALSFIGIHKGPYYRYKVFQDHFNSPYGILGSCRAITLRNLRNAAICLAGYGILHCGFSNSMYYSDEFYNDYGALYRLLYNVPIIIMFFLLCNSIFFLSLGVFAETGLGVYPSKTVPWPGYGPSVNLEIIKQSVDRIDVASELEFNFHVLTSFDYKKLLLGPRMRHTLRGWDVTVRYWFWTNIYMTVIKANHAVRSACSFVAWTIWSGASTVQMITALTFWVYIHLESEYADLYNITNAESKQLWDVGFSLVRLICLVYLAPCLVIDDTAVVLRYYNSIFWIFHLTMLGMMAFSVSVYKQRAAVTSSATPHSTASA